MLRERLHNYLVRLQLRAWVETLERGLVELDRLPPQHKSATEFTRVHQGILALIADTNAVIERLRAENGREV